MRDRRIYNLQAEAAAEQRYEVANKLLLLNAAPLKINVKKLKVKHH